MSDPSPPPSEPPAPRKLLGSPSLKLRVALWCLAALIVGALLAPRTAPTPTISVSEERVVPLLEAEVQRREPIRLFAGVEDTAQQIRIYGVAIPPQLEPRPSTMPDVASGLPLRPAPAGFGVVISPDGDVLTLASALNGRWTLSIYQGNDAEAPAQLAAYEPATDLALLHVSSQEALPAAPIATQAPQMGALAVAVGRWSGRNVVIPVFVTTVSTDRYAISGLAPQIPGGTPIFNLEGQLLAVAAGQAGMAFPAQAAIERLRQRVESGRGHPASLGVTFQRLEGLQGGGFPDRGALVSDVAGRGPAANAGIQPGDVVVDIGGASIDSPEGALEAISILTPGEEVPVALVRNGSPVPLTITVGAAFDAVAQARAPRENETTELLRVGDLFTESQLLAAQVNVEARVLTVNGQPVLSATQAVREIRRAQSPILLYLEHNGSRFFAQVAEQP